MGVYSGRLGVINGQSTMRNWNVSEVENSARYVASNTRGGSGRDKGARDWTGGFGLYGAVPTVLPGDQFTFKGQTSPDDLTPGNAGEVLTGQAVVTQLTVNWNWAGGELLAMDASFGGHLTLTKQNATQAKDSTAPAALTVVGTKIEHSTDGATWHEIPNLTSAALSLTSEVPTYVNSSTYDAGTSALWTGRTKGPIDWTLALNQEDNKPGGSNGYPAIGTKHQFRCYVNATDYWLLKWGQVGDYSNLTVDRETGAIINRTINIGMAGYKDGAVGAITLPGAGSPWWPF